MTKPIATAYLSAGSNLGDRKLNLERALQSLAAGGAQPMRISAYFETEPVGFQDQPWFLNIALEVDTCLSPNALLECCHGIERSMGRVRTFRDAPRTLDLDILLYEDRTINEPRLTVPHPRMTERKFVLKPLAQIAPELVHPVLKKTILSLLESCPDPSTVRLFSP